MILIWPHEVTISIEMTPSIEVMPPIKRISMSPHKYNLFHFDKHNAYHYSLCTVPLIPTKKDALHITIRSHLMST